MDIDEKDVDILKTIADNETRSPDHISEVTEIPLSTVNYRLKLLREAGIIRNDHYDIDLEALGFEITFIIQIIAEYDEDYHQSLGERLADIDGITHVYFTAGDTDFFVIAQLTDPDMVEDLISELEAVDGVQRTISTYTISTLRDGHEPLQQISRETMLERLVD
ncbi:Lrp/AsnC family transcriptional regulator [Halocatena marina]|uniref:Lrp/AsnC family transcriptional regulator n=1 Tax=Halocatena marina TaxID=2934937 RepID=A0ABD5YPQ9_9EURY|nr:Lrp/AsnC family transcriptional regulator [Halocatena marina]